MQRKHAARRGLTLIRELMQQGRHEAARRLALAPGVIKDSPLGSYVKMLSTAGTAEGPAVLTAHPTRGLAATKYYHPEGAATPQLIRTKERLAKIEHPANTPLLGSSYMKGLDLPVHHFEYVHGPTKATLLKTVKKTAPSMHKLDADVFSLRAKARELGLDVKDINDSNVIFDHRGQGRLIDSMPYAYGDPHVDVNKAFKERSPKELYVDMMKRMEAHGMEAQDLGPPVREIPTTTGTPANIPKRPSGTVLF